MAEVQRRVTSGGDIGGTRERRKSGIFFFNRSFKKTLVISTQVQDVTPLSRHRLKKPRPLDGKSRVDNEREHVPFRGRRQMSLPLSSNPPFSEWSTGSSTSSRSSSYTKGEAESPASTPTTPTLGPAKDFELKRTASGRSIPALAQTSAINAEAEGVLSASPKSASVSMGEATQKPSDGAKRPEGISTEELPTPPQTPGHSSAEAAVRGETGEQNETAPPVSSEIQGAEASQTEAQVPDVKKVSYHDDADLQVKVLESDGAEAIYSVRSCVLESASSVWKQQSLSSQPSTTTTTTSLDLTSDPAPGLDILFSIAHYQFQSLPQQVSEDHLHDIAGVADKYQTLHLLRPFVPGWLAALDSAAAAAPTAAAAAAETATASEKLLTTGWLLGHAPWFAAAVTSCATAASISAADGTTLLDSQGRPWNQQPVSSAVVALLAATRAAAIERIIRAVSTPVHKLLNPELYPTEDIRYCHASASADDTTNNNDDAVREECEQLQLGSAIMGLTKARLWPAPEPSRIRTSPVALARAYRDVRMRRYQTPGLRFQDDEAGAGVVKDAHAQCGLGHHAQIEAILAEPAVLGAGVVEDLAARAKVSGVYSADVFAGLVGVVAEEEKEQTTVQDAPVDA